MTNRISLGLNSTVKLIRTTQGYSPELWEIDVTAATSILRISKSQRNRNNYFYSNRHSYRLDIIAGTEKDRWNLYCDNAYVFGLQESYDDYDYLITYADYNLDWVSDLANL